VGFNSGPTTQSILRSSDGGATWFAQTPVVISLSAFLTDIAFGNGEFVALGYDNTNGLPFIVSSPDGVTWTRRADPLPLGYDNYCPHIEYFSGIRAFATHSAAGAFLGALHVSLQNLDQTWSQVFAPGNPVESAYSINPNGAGLASNGRRLVIAGTVFTIARTLNVDTF